MLPIDLLRCKLAFLQRPSAATVPRIAARTIAALNALAMRTTVPPSDASRAGAGSTTSDND